MNSKHLVDPELAPILDLLPDVPLTNETLPQARASLKAMVAAMKTAPSPDIEVTEYQVPGPQDAPPVRVLLYLPKGLERPLPALLWVHGGGFVMGSADNEDATVKNLVKQVGCAVAVVDYRLAPETPFPGPVEDCYAALKWLYQNAGELGIAPNRIAIGGSSAGAGISAGLALLTRDRGEIPLAFQLLIHPMLDDRTAVTTDPHPYTGEFIWKPQANYFGWEAMLGQAPGSEGVSPYASAARATDLAGLPPTFISVGSLDLFLEEDLEYARRLTRAGVPTEFHLYPGGFHGFNMVATAQVTQALQRDFVNALKRALRA
ncbi:MAG: alpha/beta hydrolase [Chloroflexi bacterium]|nr:alpha/beta hydrolase [Chloroflexota bacterium]OJV95287.1 MAG: arylesterase [Chloroflexi bacterium 54-19]